MDEDLKKSFEEGRAKNLEDLIRMGRKLPTYEIVWLENYRKSHPAPNETDPVLTEDETKEVVNFLYNNIKDNHKEFAAKMKSELGEYIDTSDE